MPEAHFPYDRTLRELLQRIPKRFTELLTGRQVVEVLDPTFPEVRERRADFLGRFEDGRLVHVELQLQHDPALMERMVEYLLMIKNRYKEVPVQIILWLGEGRPPYAEEVEIGPLRFRCAVRDIKELSREALLESETGHYRR
jgi:predicted transposase YdaD